MCCTDRVSLPSLSGSDGGNSSIYVKCLPAVLEGMGKLVYSRGCAIQCHMCSKLVNFWFIYLGLAWPGIQLVFIVLLFSALSEPHHLHKAFNHPVISMLFIIFIYRILLLMNVLILGMLSICCLCWRVGHQPLLTTFELAWKTATLLALITGKHCSYFNFIMY